MVPLRRLPDAAEAMSPSSSQQAKKARMDQQQAAPAAGPPAAAAGAAAAPPAAAAGGQAAAASVEKVWAKGTGYGWNTRGTGSAGPVWDPKAAAAAQQAQDEQLNSVLQSLAAALREEFPSSNSSSSGSEEGGQGLSGSQEKCLTALHDSVLRPLLARELSQVAFPEMVQRHQYFKPLLSVMGALCHPAIEPFLVGNAAEGDEDSAAAGSSSGSRAGRQQSGRVVSIAGAVRGLQKGANIVKKELTKALEAAPTGNTSRVDKQAGGS